MKLSADPSTIISDIYDVADIYLVADAKYAVLAGFVFRLWQKENSMIDSFHFY